MNVYLFFEVLILCYCMASTRSEAGYSIQVSTADLYQYRYLTNYGIPTPNSTHMLFRVRACNDAHVILRSSGKKEIEIVLGGWNNTISCLRTKVQGPCHRKYNGRVLNCKSYEEFLISWKDGRIMVGKTNSELGSFGDLLLDYQLRKPLSGVQIGVSTGFGAAGKWMFEAPAAGFERRFKNSPTMLDRQQNYSQRHNSQPSVGERCVRELKKTHNCFQVKRYNITLCIMINTEEIFQADMDYTQISIEYGDMLCSVCCILPDRTKQYNCVQMYCLNRKHTCINPVLK
ncbi:uncharacterized protein LOC111123640 isoform X1 [Crassostrea virginica]|uniref:Uncharacterized protein LOC111126514 isoform X1 n=1 Tax=Crassostrea virginica TaxID=6565 RepID=A0A8B8DH66_CRAVI|nr:uncharacterized protein LOC111126514 isoform X1 [Crassostrea virginica]